MNAPVRLFQPGDDRSPSSTVQDVIDAYLDEKRLQLSAGACCEKSLYRAEFYLKSFCQMFGKQPTSACKRADLTKWLVAHPEWQSGFTKQDATGCVVTCFRWAEGELLIERSVYRRPRFVGAPCEPRPAILPHEFRAMWRHARRACTKYGKRMRTRYYFLVALAFLWHTGCRTCEMREVEWKDIDWQAAIASLEKNKTKRATGKNRLIPLRRVLRLLKLVQKHNPPGREKVFLNTLGRPWRCDRFAKEFRRYARMAGVRDEVSAYCLRHGLTVRLIRKGRSDRQIANALGQEGTRYVSWYGRTSQTQADHLNDVIG